MSVHVSVQHMPKAGGAPHRTQVRDIRRPSPGRLDRISATDSWLRPTSRGLRRRKIRPVIWKLNSGHGGFLLEEAHIQSDQRDRDIRLISSRRVVGSDMNAISLRGSRRANLISPDVTMIRMLGHRLRTVAAKSQPVNRSGHVSVREQRVGDVGLKKNKCLGSVGGLQAFGSRLCPEVHRVAAYRVVLDNQNVSVFGIAPVVLAKPNSPRSLRGPRAHHLMRASPPINRTRRILIPVIFILSEGPADLLPQSMARLAIHSPRFSIQPPHDPDCANY